ncbi:MAG: hypothetical protein R2843_10705 [Thermomicrobiales bacterium]
MAAIKVYGRNQAFMDAVLTLQDQVLDELNIKAVLPLVDLGDVVTYDVKPNLGAARSEIWPSTRGDSAGDPPLTPPRWLRKPRRDPSN